MRVNRAYIHMFCVFVHWRFIFSMFYSKIILWCTEPLCRWYKVKPKDLFAKRNWNGINVQKTLLMQSLQQNGEHPKVCDVGMISVTKSSFNVKKFFNKSLFCILIFSQRRRFCVYIERDLQRVLATHHTHLYTHTHTHTKPKHNFT